MTSNWTVLLQDAGSPNPEGCERFVVRGLAVPAQITVRSCDPVAAQSAAALLTNLRRRLGAIAQATRTCNGPAELGCIAWDESACQHVLILVIGDQQLASRYEQLTADWLRKAPGSAVVIPALVPPLTHAQLFDSGQYPKLASCTAAPWEGSILVLSQIVIEAALLERRPGIFISYLRNDAAAVADQIHDSLRRIGFRVFLDRFSGTPGHVFPFELAEAMVEMDAVLVLETANISRSQWTLWEAAFAHRYRLGPMAVNFASSPCLRAVGTRRHSEAGNPGIALPVTNLDSVVSFVQARLPEIAIARRAYYETLIRVAANSKNGVARRQSDTVLAIEDRHGVLKAHALTIGVPARLNHVRRIAGIGLPPAPVRFIAGEHHHLQTSARGDLQWLANQTGVTLTGSASVFRAIQRIV